MFAAPKVKWIILCGIFYHNTLANDALKEAHNVCQTVARKLKQDVDTRWNSRYDTLQSRETTAIGMSENPNVSIIEKEFDTLQEATRPWSPSTSRQLMFLLCHIHRFHNPFRSSTNFSSSQSHAQMYLTDLIRWKPKLLVVATITLNRADKLTKNAKNLPWTN